MAPERKDDFLSQLARKPTGTKVGILVALIALIGLAYWNFMEKPLDEKITSVKQENQGLLSQKQQLEKKNKEYKKLLAGRAELEQRAVENDRKLPLSSDPIFFVDYVAKRAASSLVGEFRHSDKGSKQVGSFVKTSIHVSGKATFYQWLRFFHVLSPEGAASDTSVDARDAPTVTIEELELTSPQVIDGQVYLIGKFMASTFHLANATPRKKRRGRRLKGAEGKVDAANRQREADVAKALGKEPPAPSTGGAKTPDAKKGLNRVMGNEGVPQ